MRVAHFHRETVIALAELIAAAGLNHPRELRPYHFMRRTGPDRIVSFTELYRFMEPGELLSGTTHPSLKEAWEVASPESFCAARRLGAGKHHARRRVRAWPGAIVWREFPVFSKD